MTQIEKIMKELDVSEEEAREILADDEKIDKGEKLFSLTAEQEKASKKARKSSTGVYKLEKRERKPNDLKRAMLAAILNGFVGFEFADKQAKLFEVVKPEKEFTFTYDGISFSVSLTQHRSPKS